CLIRTNRSISSLLMYCVREISRRGGNSSSSSRHRESLVNRVVKNSKNSLSLPSVLGRMSPNLIRSHNRRLFLFHRSWLRAYWLARALLGSGCEAVFALDLFFRPLLRFSFFGGGSSFTNCSKRTFKSVSQLRKSIKLDLKSESVSRKISLARVDRKSTTDGKFECSRT